MSHIDARACWIEAREEIPRDPDLVSVRVDVALAAEAYGAEMERERILSLLQEMLGPTSSDSFDWDSIPGHLRGHAKGRASGLIAAISRIKKSSNA